MSALYESFELDDIKYGRSTMRVPHTGILSKSCEVFLLTPSSEIGECVLIRSSASRQQACFIGKIEEIGVNDDDHITLKVGCFLDVLSFPKIS